MAVCFGSEITADDKEPEMPVRYYIRSSNISVEKCTSAMLGLRVCIIFL